MDGPRSVGACLVGACLALSIVACAPVNPAVAFADQTGSGETGVFVTMEHEDAPDVPAIKHGDVGKDVEAANETVDSGGPLPKTGDVVGALALGVALCGVAGASSVLLRLAKNRFAHDDEEE